MVYLQPTGHIKIFTFEYGQWEVYIEDNRQYSLHVRTEDTIEIEDIKNPEASIFQKVFVGLFDYEWVIHGSLVTSPPGDEQGFEELEDIIKAIESVSN
jgi:hypothetical protein